ncbi:MAG TPA: hypothetical protein VNQ14_12735 [Woeseiaceae bacterium]|nr:hypothetical protein [Woeseiaceae bacterium]
MDKAAANTVVLSLLLALCPAVHTAEADMTTSTYAGLVQLFNDWREFERPPMRAGAPDYSGEYLDQAYVDFEDFRTRLMAMDIADWPVEQQADWHVVRAEMNGFDFNYRVLKPWARDPAFYQTVMTERSDVPDHAGPTHHAVIDLWAYRFPLSDREQQRLVRELQVIPPLMIQARDNLTGNARDLWIAGIRNIHQQSEDLDSLLLRVGAGASAELKGAIADARRATDDLAEWLEEQAPVKTGPSGVGKDNYTWSQRNVHYVPFTWEEEVALLERELARAWSSLKLEEHRNRNLPQQTAARTREELERRADEAATALMNFLSEQEIMTVKPYHEPALREHLTNFVEEDDRNFFSIISHFDPKPLYSHSYHWFDLAQMQEEPGESPIRRRALLYNIFDNRAEGIATAVEEMFMHAGLYDDNPRSRELVWIMLAQRAARGLGSLYAQANEMTMEEAGTVHMKWTPRGWMGNEPRLLRYEQQLYLRQPGYGTSYITGKLLIDRLLMSRTREMQGQEYSLADFLDELNRAGPIPLTLIHWQLTDDDADVRTILDGR